MKEKNQSGRLLVILLITAIVCISLYWLPDHLFGFPIRKVDMLSDIRIEIKEDSSDSLQCSSDDVLLADVAPLIDSKKIKGFDSIQILQRDSLYQSIVSDIAPGKSDSVKVRIEDFSVGHTGLHHFFSKLNQIHTLNRPVRIAFLGDSFIEGDIVVADFRAKMQTYFGGQGVGLVPVASQVAQYRPTVDQRSKGWKTRSILSDRKCKYVLTGLLFEPEGEEASISFKTVTAYPRLEKVSSLKFLYARNRRSELRLIYNEKSDTIEAILPPADSIVQFEAEGEFTQGNIRIRQAGGLQALGLALEDNSGVVVDNFSLRGNSGIVMRELDEASCRSLGRIRPYDLIILQYGLNVAAETSLEYGWYRERMVKVIQHVQTCFPEADVLLLGVSDRSCFRGGTYKTMPAVVSLLRSQRNAAKQAKIPFWSIYNAMGGENSMARYVKYRWASKDHTHLSFRGGQEIATSLFDALMLEKKLYDELETAYE
jgi:lysophospholipase L1-like esterase